MVRQGEQSLACAGILRIGAEQLPNRGVHVWYGARHRTWARGPTGNHIPFIIKSDRLLLHDSTTLWM